MHLTTLDLGVVIFYVLILLAAGWLAARERPGVRKDSNSYFLAGRRLRWWAVGSSLIAVNITAAAVVSMSGSGFAVGLGIASYEWLGAITLIIIGKYFLPIFLRDRVQTLPQFLALRYNRGLSVLISIIWIVIYILIGLTTLLWLAATVIEVMTGMERMLAMLALGLITVGYSLYGGLKAIAVVDIIQVAMLILGGVLISWITMNEVSQGHGFIAGFIQLTERAPERFDMILSPDNPNWKYLPGITVLVGGMWVLQLAYWGFNQYIMQRAMAAKDLREAQAGTIFAAWLKLLVPALVILPGIAAWALRPELPHADLAYPTMVALAPPGVRGLIFAALSGAAVSALGSLLNSIATLFTLNLYKPLFPDTPEHQLVQIGRVCALGALLFSILVARPMLGETEQVFQYIQHFTSYLAPGITVLFLLGMYWERTTTFGASLALFASPLLTLLYQWLLPNAPFMVRAGHVFFVCLALAALASCNVPRARRRGRPRPDFSTSASFNCSAALLIIVLGGLYWLWW